MAKKSLLASDSELHKHMGQPGLYAHQGADYFTPRREFFDGSLSPRFNVCNCLQLNLWVIPVLDGNANEALATDAGGNFIWRTHDELAGYASAEHLSLPGTIANVLSNHTKAVHDALNIDADTLDSINSLSFLRSDINDNLTAAIIVPDANRDEGIFGTYVSAKTQHIWSMGTAYRNSPTGADFGNLYGLAYKYNGYAGGHGVYLVNYGVEQSALGLNVWTSGVFITTKVTGTAPLTVASTTKVTNLNVDRVDDYHSDDLVPCGTIMAWIGGYFTGGNNAGYTRVLGSANTVAGANGYLNSKGWYVCNGAVLNDADSPIFNGAGRYLPNLTDDRFIMGDTAAGGIGGSSTMAHTHQVNPANRTSTAGTAHSHGTSAKTTAIQSASHSHVMKGHTHVINNRSHQHSVAAAAEGSGGQTGWSNGCSTPTAGPSDNITGLQSSNHTHGYNRADANESAHTHDVNIPVFASEAASNTENRPKFLSAFYIMRVK